MKRHRVLGTLVAVGLCCGLIGSARAGGVADFPSCLVNRPGHGARALKGTLAVEVIGNVITGDGVHDVDFTLRLERSGQQHFFRLFLDDTEDFGFLSDQERVCRILNPADTTAEPANQAKVIQFVNQILTAFDIPTDWRLVITKRSIRDTDGGPNRVIPGTVPPGEFIGRASGLADVKIYAVEL
jgi:hypothetical protein